MVSRHVAPARAGGEHETATPVASAEPVLDTVTLMVPVPAWPTLKPGHDHEVAVPVGQGVPFSEAAVMASAAAAVVEVDVDVTTMLPDETPPLNSPAA